MVEKLRSYDEEPLPQALQEGVDDDEWVSKKLHFFFYNLSYEEVGGKDSNVTIPQAETFFLNWLYSVNFGYGVESQKERTCWQLNIILIK